MIFFLDFTVHDISMRGMKRNMIGIYIGLGPIVSIFKC